MAKKTSEKQPLTFRGLASWMFSGSEKDYFQLIFGHERTIVVIGGFQIGNYWQVSKSIEIFSWRLGKWILAENCLCSPRVDSFSFRYGTEIMICGGQQTPGIEQIECLTTIDNETSRISNTSSISLPENARSNGLLYEDRILTFDKGVVETSLETPGESRVLLKEQQPRLVPAGVHRFDDDVYIVGEKQSFMELYNVVMNEMETLLYPYDEKNVATNEIEAFPRDVFGMASVAYKNNIVFLGGQNAGSESPDWEPLNDVVMYNIYSTRWERLPYMLEKRTLCTAVVTHNQIVVMGGQSKNPDGSYRYLNTVEYFEMGKNAWRRMPSMNLCRARATACMVE